MPTLKDVAQRAGVSYATVSRVLARKVDVRSETARRVFEAADALGYVPNRAARSLRTRRTKIIGVIVSDIQYEFFPPLVRAIEDQASELGYSVLLCNADERPAKQAKYVNLLMEENVSGAIVAPTGKDPESLRSMHDAGIPMVLVDRTVASLDVDAVVVDNVDAAYRATLHLFDQGFTSIAAIVGSDAATTADERLAGYVAAVRERGADHRPDWVRRGSPTMESGYAAMMALLGLDDPPDAVFLSNHLLAAGAFQASKERGANQRIGLVTFDDEPWASFVDPPLTTIKQPTYQIGRVAIDMLLSRIGGLDEPARLRVLPTELVVRRSTSQGSDRSPWHPVDVRGGGMR